MPVTDGREWQREIEARLRELLPIDFPECVPIYLVGRRELSARFDRPGSWIAYTRSFIDLRLRPLLQTQGKWKGRGFAAVFFEDRFPLRALAQADFLDWLLNVALHEAAHFLDDTDSPFATAEIETFDAMHRQIIEEVLAGDVHPPPAGARESSLDSLWEAVPRPFVGHETRFIRAAVHLAARAATRGFSTAGDTADFMSLHAAGEKYGTSGFDAYRESLADEPQCLAEIPIRQILATPAPAEFMRLWKGDLYRIEKSWRRARLAANWCPEPFQRGERTCR